MVTTNNWYQIISSNTDECDDISSLMGQSRDVILPTLINLGYITRFSNTLVMNNIKLENLRNKISGIFNLHISDSHPKGENRQYFMCLGKPQYSGPTKQMEANKKGKLTHCNLHYLVRDDTIFKTNLQAHVDIILKRTNPGK